jgi:hypothetical protein
MAFGDVIDESMAKDIAAGFYNKKVCSYPESLLKSGDIKNQDFKLIYQENESTEGSVLKKPVFYVFNNESGNGFVIVSAESETTPVLGYSDNTAFDPSNIPPSLKDWFQHYRNQIQLLRNGKNNATGFPENSFSDIDPGKEVNESSELLPLIKTKWEQGCFYNDFCPSDAEGPCEHVLVGCVAVVMGQIMNYWKYPESCNDIPGYSTDYGWIPTIKSSVYNWSIMPESLNKESNSAVVNSLAELLYHCGVSTKMDYAHDESSTNSLNAAQALVNTFKYPQSVKYRERKDYSSSEWHLMMKNELNNKRPLYYSGNGIGSHAFICDGYQNVFYYHFNWGWGGDNDGYYVIDLLTPENYDFNNGQTAITGITKFDIPVIEYQKYEIINDKDSSGLVTSNGIAEPGECFDMPVTIKNFGSGSANNIELKLSCEDNDINIINDSVSLEKIKKDSLVRISDFRISVNENCQDKDVSFRLIIKSEEGEWMKFFSIHIFDNQAIRLNNPGDLYNILTSDQRKNTTYIRIKGRMDARDFKILRDSMPSLSIIDLKEVVIERYYGTEGTKNSISVEHPATMIPPYAFFNQKTSVGKNTLRNIILPQSVTAIGDFAFYNCKNLQTIDLSKTLVTIGNMAFSECSNLADILRIPSSVKSIGTSAFSNCNKLTGLVLPDSLTRIESSCFFECYAIRGNLVIPDKVNFIGSSAFYGCTGFSSVSIPQNVQLIENSAFLDFSGEINVSQQNSYYSSLGGVLFNKDQTSLMQCPVSKKGTYTIPSTVVTIGNSAFSGCIYLSEILLPVSVKVINNYAFSGCSGLNSLQLPAYLTTINQSAFQGCSNIKSNIIIPSTVNIIGNSAFNGCNNVNSVIIPNTVTSIGSLAFSNFGGLFLVDETNPNYASLDGVLYNKKKTMLIQSPNTMKGTFKVPQNVNIIGNYAFTGCNELTEILLPKSLKVIGNNAFTSLKRLSGSFSIPDSVTDIGNSAFSGCSDLRTIIISSKGLKNIGESAFSGCVNLRYFYIFMVEPVDLSLTNNTFYLVNKNICALYVPEGSLVKYSNASQWKEFKRIKEMKNISVSTDNIRIANAESSKANLIINSNTNWTISSDKSWLNLTPEYGFGNDTIKLTANRNMSSEERIANMTVTSVDAAVINITVIQDAGNYLLEIDEDTSYLSFMDGSTDTLKVNSNILWTSKSDASWLNVSSDQYSGNGSVIIKASANNSRNVRLATITFSGEEIAPRYVTVIQGTPYILKPQIYKKWNDVLICDNSTGDLTSFQWYLNDNMIEGETGQYLYKPDGFNGRYYVEVSGNNGLKGISNTIAFDMIPNSEILKIYPNPVFLNKTITVNIDINSEELKEYRLIVMDINGLVIQDFEDLKDSMVIGIKNKGTYIIALKNKTNKLKDSVKLIVKPD